MDTESSLTLIVLVARARYEHESDVRLSSVEARTRDTTSGLTQQLLNTDGHFLPACAGHADRHLEG